MWRITYLYLKNISYLYSGLHKNEVEIDFKKLNQNSKLNLLIGPMGSGKSVILGHLQPFASFGTLDSRNSEQMVLTGVNGKKIIEYDHNSHHYVIVHDYIWNKNLQTHNVKSYLELDGEELNSNGNSGSFKELVKLHFGIDQSFLRILRLGPNVSNVISMKSTERKKFIASLREDTEIYLQLYKKLSDEFRVMKASITSVSNRLMKLSATDIDKMRDQEAEWEREFDETKRDIDGLVGRIGELKGRNASLCGGNLEEYTRSRDKLEDQRKEIQDDVETLTELIEETSSSSETVESISVKIGECRSRRTIAEDQLMALQQELKRLEAEVNRLNEYFLTKENASQLEYMKQTRDELDREVLRYQSKLSGFHCSYSYDYLTKLVEELNIFQEQLEDLSSLDEETFKTLRKNLDANIGKLVEEKIRMLRGRQVNLQKSLSNIRFSATYVEPFPVFRHPMCRFENCPYVTTHPVTLRDSMVSDQERDATIVRITNEINQLDPVIARYQEMPVIQKKLQLLRNQWNRLGPILVELGVVQSGLSLWELLSNPLARRDWYHYDRLIGIIEKVKMLEEFNGVRERYDAVDREIRDLEDPEIQTNRERLKLAIENRDKTMSQLESLSEEIQSMADSVESYESLYEKLQKRADYEIQLSERRESLALTEQNLAQIDQNLETIRENLTQINGLERERFTAETRYTKIQSDLDSIRSTMRQIEYNQEEYNSLMESARGIQMVMDAVSSKKGIPLILVKNFLNNCREIVNELISDVFDEELEVLDFDITETDFKIPYMVNGQVIDDISYASQGQQSIISIALSFALVRQSIQQTGGLNIMLLDEMDGPLHRDDREKFISILFRQMSAINADQVFIISHNSTFSGNPINILSTSDEVVDSSPNQIVVRL